MDLKDVEQHDAERVDQAIEHIEDGDVSLAYELLSDVATRAPATYTYQYEAGDTLCVKFWDNREFMHYVTWQQAQGQSRNVTWVKSAYPRACYYLGYLEIEAGRYDDALRFLEFGRSLEPTNPALAIEQAHALASVGRYWEALRLYDQVQTLGPHVRGDHIARALRGKGYVLVELGALGSAEKCYRKSLDHEPESEVAANELEYISSVIAEKRASGSETSSESSEQEHEDEETSQSSAGANHWSSIGFPLQTGIAILELAARAAKNGVPIEAGRGTYIRWSAGVGAELWAQTDRDGNLMGLNPHFSGDAKLRVRLEDRILYPGAPVLDGAFYGWANPDGARAEGGDCPLVFDTPDYELHRLLELPVVMDVQLSAFARELHAFRDEAEFYASKWGESFAAESFVPSGLFEAAEGGDPPQPYAIFTGYVVGTSLLTNPVTGAAFYWARVSTLGGEVDVVADPEVLEGTLVEGGVVCGWFWLSGRLLVHPQAE